MTRGRASDSSPIGDDELSALFATWDGSSGVLIAVSGGPDSLALLGLAARWRDKGGRAPLFAATFDHGLRREAAREARGVKAFAGALGVSHRTLRWTGDKPATGLQEQARAARYAALAAYAHTKKCDSIALAHHRDDQAETVLMRLAAGSGLDGLGGMRPDAARDDGLRLRRPFLDLPKSRLIATCDARGWAFADDPSNRDSRFARARWRALAPDLVAEGLTPARLARLAARARRAEEALESAVDDWLGRFAPQPSGAGWSIDGQAWAATPAEIRLRIVGRLIARAAGPDAAPERLERLERLVDDLYAAAAKGAPCARNLRGALVRLATSGRLTATPEPARRQTRRSS